MGVCDGQFTVRNCSITATEEKSNTIEAVPKGWTLDLVENTPQHEPAPGDRATYIIGEPDRSSAGTRKSRIKEGVRNINIPAPT